MTGTTDSSKGGIPLGLAAYAIWGFMPLYFKLLASVQPAEIVAHRIIWSLILLALLATVWRRWGGIRAALGTGRVLFTLIVTACLIAVNWLVYIYAIVSGHVLEGSLGYYLNPLVNVLLRRAAPEGKADPRAGLRLSARRRRRRGDGRGRLVGALDQPDAGAELRLLRLPPQGRAGGCSRGPVGRDARARPGGAALGAGPPGTGHEWLCPSGG